MACRINRLTPFCQAGLNQPAPNKRHLPNGKNRSDVVLKVREGPIPPRKTAATSARTAERFLQKGQRMHTQAQGG